VFRIQQPQGRIYISAGCASWLIASLLLAAQPLHAQSNAIKNQAQYNYDVIQDISTGSQDNNPLIQGLTTEVVNNFAGIIDPLGKITGCDGNPLPDASGYIVTVYNAAPDKLNPASLLLLTPTIPGGIPLGIAPNDLNANPYTLNFGSASSYNFLFNQASGQLDIGKSYILVVKPPAASTFGERRVRLDITGFANNIVSYRATSLDGQNIGLTDSTTFAKTVTVKDAATVGLSLISLSGVGVGVCDAQALRIVKSADRSAAEPGDTVVYRLTLTNTSSSGNQGIRDPKVTDVMPQGMFLRPDSVRAQIGGQLLKVKTTQAGNTNTFEILDANGAPGFIIPVGQVVNLVYAVTLDADAVRGTGRNIATFRGVSLDGTPGGKPVTDGPVGYQLAIRQGILRDTGTLIGRVFVDKNFDGEQQSNEPGIPNAVIFLDDGNRITTDANGLFSVQSVAPGYRTGILDIGSLPGYALAPNLYFSERNSRSRLVKLAPGGMVRMNFAVTPTAREAK
jgi:uncharacterized repeat protein (TIGR01451 family)